MKLKSQFSSSLLKARTELGYTQSEVAEAVSVSTRWYQKIESGERLPGTVTAITLMVFLNIEVKDLREAVNFVVPVRHVQRTLVLR